MSIKNTLFAATFASLVAAALTVSAPAQSSDAGAFIGGVFATKLIGNMRRQTQAQEQQAYNSSRPVQQAAPAAPAAKTTKQRLDELDKLAAGGYISKSDYKTKKKAILDSL